jgi:solute carrier family 35, member E3
MAGGTPDPSYGIIGGIIAWFVEFSSAVAIILCNKALMSGRFDFRYPVTLTAAHFAWTAAGSAVIRGCTDGDVKQSPELPHWWVVGGFVGISCAAIIMSNASLLLNTVTFYQISKLLTLPFVAVIEWAEGTKRYMLTHVPIFATILAGVTLTIRGNAGLRESGIVGAVVAIASVVTTGLHQIYCGRLQARYGMSPSALLAVVSPIKATLLFSIGPAIDALAFGGWITEYDWSIDAAGLVATTCALAIALNLSQYTVIRALGAGPYQAFSQLKTAAVIVLGSVVFEGKLHAQQIIGAGIAVCGVIALTTLEQRLRSQQPQDMAPDVLLVKCPLPQSEVDCSPSCDRIKS